MPDDNMILRFWGVRGSYPVPGPRTVGVGGNTACVEIQAGPTPKRMAVTIAVANANPIMAGDGLAEIGT